ncbi:MAG TPA: hypothetical protein DCP03_06725 [Polaromonas sp.]|uniref:hypothetical protein n=1 Tax=Polaromonas sp. UBA4122 TaxID=1947074 RepID=UPI000EE7F24B|nr:hypothetical protein [Polaromonas sp. UBA4122]HAL37816.1 hypothetical protein [Polaromonas sp.]
MTYKTQDIALSKIYLDNENPRHNPISNEIEIIKHLLQTEDVKPLARDIADAGSTSPLELIALVPHSKVKNTYIPAEGNRRVCALKLLADPQKADTEANKKYFQGLKAGMSNPIKTVSAVVFQDKDAARRWVSLRHEGLQGGVGTKPWNPQQTERFSRQGGGKSNPNTLASLLVDYVREHGLLSSEQLNAVSITTLTRYLSNPVFRDTLGLVDNRSLKINVPVDEFRSAVRRFLEDTVNPSSGVSSRTSVAERRDYAHKLRSEGVAPITRSQPQLDLSAIQPEATAKPVPPPAPPVTTRDNRNPDLRKHVIPSSFRVRINDKILKRLYDELKELDATQFHFCAVYLLRTVIEKSTVLYLKQNVVVPAQPLHKKLAQLAELLKTQGMTERDLKILRTMATTPDDVASPDTLGHYVHGGAVPHKTYAFRYWDSIENVMTVVLEKLK